MTQHASEDELNFRLAAIIDSSDDAIIATNVEGTITSWNAAACRIFGYSTEEAIGRPVTLLGDPARVGEMEGILSRIRQGESVNHLETVRRHKNGGLINIMLTVSPIRSKSGQIVGASKIARDITEQKLVQRATLYLAAIVENSDDAIISKDLNGIVTSWNRAAERIFGYTAAEMVGNPIAVLAAPERINDMPLILARIRAGERVEHYETFRRRKNGEVIAISLTVSPIRDTAGVIIGASKIARDITEQKRDQETLHRTNLELRRANRDLEQFAYTASHDLQEPLRMIAIYSQMLQRKFTGKLDKDEQQYFEYAIDGARRARELVDDLLAYTRVAVHDEDEPTLASAGDALEQALKNLTASIRDSDASIEHGTLPEVSAHPVHLRQLFQNLIGNALKYRSPAVPRIEIAASKRGDEWEFSVKDNGIGIAPAYHEQIFDIFKRLHPASQYDGTGIGLALCRRIVERYGGQIWVESSLGQGAKFLFTLPVVSAAVNQHPPRSVPTDASS